MIKFPLPLFVAVSAMTLSACSATTMQKAQHADGLLDFVAALAGQSAEDALPVEQVSDAYGQIATAHVRRKPDGFRVNGVVRKTSFVDPPVGAHVDVFLLDARKRVIESITTRYLPRDISRGPRAARQSRYAAWLRTTNAPQGATIRVVFHSESDKNHVDGSPFPPLEAGEICPFRSHGVG